MYSVDLYWADGAKPSQYRFASEESRLRFLSLLFAPEGDTGAKRLVEVHLGRVTPKGQGVLELERKAA